MTSELTSLSTKTFSIPLPPKTNNTATDIFNLSAGSSAVFLGANGAGKTRFAGWIDKRLGNESTFIHASRSLAMPSAYTISEEQKEMSAIYAGTAMPQATDIKQFKDFRYRNDSSKPFASADFNHVMNVVGTRHASESIRFASSYDPEKPPKLKPLTTWDTVVRIFQACLPHLSLSAVDAPEIRIKRLDYESAEYQPKSLSDGERAIFYLTAKCLIAPRYTVVIVDEPEMYVHPSVRNTLWDLIEAERRDCAFIYFTHDMDFASSRNFHHRWLLTRCFPQTEKDVTQNRWDYEQLAEFGDVPESTMLSVLGSRKKVLFVEGCASSLDRKIASSLYSDWQVRCLGSCENVIRTVKALGSVPQLHHRQAAGLIDRDFRGSTELESLRAANIYSHGLREIENVLVSEAVIAAALANLGSDEPHTVIASIHQIAKLRLIKRVPVLSKHMALRQIREDVLNSWAKQKSAFLEEVEIADLSWPDIYASQQAHSKALTDILELGSWDEMLSIFSARKEDFRDVVAAQVGFKSWNDAEGVILGWLAQRDSEPGRRILTAMQHYFPRLQSDE